MSLACAALDAFLDERLSPEEADAFRLHLGECDACGRALRDRLTLEVLEDAHRDVLKRETRSAASRPGTWSRARRVIPILSTLALAAAIFGVTLRSSFFAPRPKELATLDLETAATRSVEARFTSPAADVYRPYDVQRGATASHDSVSMTTLAALEARADYQGVAAGLILSGDPRRASEYLDRAGASPDVACDRAALALQEGRPEEAIDRLDAVLVEHPNHPQALWNEALALNALHLPLLAAQTWQKVAALGEPGWSAEAKRRADELSVARDAHRKGWLAFLESCRGVVLEGDVPPAALSAPSQYRPCLYAAMVAAPSRERLQSLRPLALRLDGDVKGPLVRALDRMAVGVERRRPFRDRFVTLYKTETLPGGDAEVERFLDELRKAGQDDLFFEAVDRTYRWRYYAEDLERIARDRDDPWMAIIAQRGRAKAEEARGDYNAAQRTFGAAIADCDARHFGALCAKLAYQSVLDLFRAYRLREAEHAAVAAFPRAEAYSDDVNHLLRVALGASASKRGDPALARAYALDAMMREPTYCEGRSDAYEISADGYLEALAPEKAAAALELGPVCPGIPMSLLRARELTVIARMEGAPPPPGLRAALVATRAASTPAQGLQADAIEGNLLLSTDAAAGESRLRETIDAARPITFNSDAQAALDWSVVSLGWQAAARGDGAAAAALFAKEAGLPSTRCTLTVGVDHERVFSVAADAQGGFLAAHEAHAARLPPPRDTLIPPASLARLRDCGEVQVLASAPVHGMPGLLPADVAWSYRVAGAPRAAAAPSSEKRLIVSDVREPSSLGLPPLQGLPAATANDAASVTWLRGDDANADRVLSELGTATEVQLHTHGLLDVGESDAPLLVLSPDATGRWALTARDVATVHMSGHPIVVLAACNSSRTTPSLHEHWSLAAAFIRAGARSVIASAAEIPDAPAARFFDALLARVRAGANPAEALRDERVAWRTRPDGAWVDGLLLFE